MKFEKKYILRFWERVSKSSKCWNWMGWKDVEGYGRFCVKRKGFRAHRFSWIIKHGNIPSELYVCHKCDNPSCVRPGHLFLGTALDNNRDREKKGRGKGIPPRVYGKDNCKTKLNPEKVFEIRKMISENFTLKDIAKKFNVTPRSIAFIRDGLSWNYV